MEGGGLNRGFMYGIKFDRKLITASLNSKGGWDIPNIRKILNVYHESQEERLDPVANNPFYPGKALDNIDLNQMSHQYVSGD